MDFNVALDRFVRCLTLAKQSHQNRNFRNIKSRCAFAVEHGKRQARIVDVQYGGRSVYCFVEYETGKIMRPGGWKGPEPKRYERGNIYRDNPLEGCGPYGVGYRILRGGYAFSAEDIEASKAGY